MLKGEVDRLRSGIANAPQSKSDFVTSVKEVEAKLGELFGAGLPAVEVFYWIDNTFTLMKYAHRFVFVVL